MKRFLSLFFIIFPTAVIAGLDVTPTIQSIDVSQFVTTSQVSSLSPVQSVNTKTGVVTIPTLCRQSSPAQDASPGSVSWTFPNTACSFAAAPTCYPSLAATNTNFSFDVPITTAVNATAVTMKVTAHPISLGIASLTLPINLTLTTAPPSGTTLTMTCTGVAQ